MKIKRIALAILVITMFSACSIGSLKNKDTELYEVDGLWTGYTEARQAIIFDVRDRAITRVQVGYNNNSDNCVYTRSFKFIIRDHLKLTENNFSLADHVYGDVINGVFESNSTASGKYLTASLSSSDCIWGTSFKWKAIKNLEPDTNNCIAVTIDKTIEHPNINNFPAIEKTSDMTCLRINNSKFVKRAAGSIIAPKTRSMASYFIWIPNETYIMYDDGYWRTENFEALKSKDDEILLPSLNLPILKWDGSFYVALVDFYEVIDMADWQK